MIIIIIIIQALLDLMLNMEDMLRLRSLVVVLLSLVQDREVTDSPSLEVVHLLFPVEMEMGYRSLTVKHLLSLALSPMVDTLDRLRPLVDIMRLLDLLHTLVDIILFLDLLHTVAVDIMHLLDLLHTSVDIILVMDLLHTAAADIMHLLDLLQDSLTRMATEEVPVLLNSLKLIRTLGHGLSSRAVITLPIQAEVVDGEAKNMIVTRSFSVLYSYV